MAKVEKIFLRVPPALKDRWQAAVDETKAPQNQVGIALVEFFLSLNRHEKADLLAGTLTTTSGVSDGIELLEVFDALPQTDQQFAFDHIVAKFRKDVVRPITRDAGPRKLKDAASGSKRKDSGA